MTRPIEAVLAEAQRRLESSGELDVSAVVSAHPDHAHELGELLPVMLLLHEKKQWQAASERSAAFGVSLFGQLKAEESTVADLLAEERTNAGLSLAEQAQRSGLPLAALELLARDRTPVSRLRDNATLRQLANQAAAPFGALVKEVRRLLSLQSLGNINSPAVFTRDSQSSTDAERQALVAKVRESVRKPPEEQ